MKTLTELHRDIINIPVDDEKLLSALMKSLLKKDGSEMLRDTYKAGHRDALSAAADVIAKTEKEKW